MVTAMPKAGDHRLILRVAAAVALGVAIIVAAVIVPSVRAYPMATRGLAIRAFWLLVAIPQVFIAAMLLLISLFIRPGRRALNLASGTLGLISLVLVFALLDAAAAFLRHGPGMRMASAALFVCAGLDILVGAIAVKVAISRYPEAGKA